MSAPPTLSSILVQNWLGRSKEEFFLQRYRQLAVYRQLAGGTVVKNPPANPIDGGLISGLERKRQPDPVFLPGKFHGQRRQVGYNPWGRMTV